MLFSFGISGHDFNSGMYILDFREAIFKIEQENSLNLSKDCRTEEALRNKILDTQSALCVHRSHICGLNQLQISYIWRWGRGNASY